MIMCHKNLEQVFCLAKHLTTSQSDVVVHIDASVNDNDVHTFIGLCKSFSNIYITNDRIKGSIDDRSLVDIVFIMIQFVKDKGLKYDYYALLSGQDYPIKPINYINSVLEMNYPKPFIDCTPYDKNNWIQHKFCSKQMRYLNRIDRNINVRFNNSLLRYSLKLPVKALKVVCPLFKMSLYDKLKRANILPYGGSAWWILPDIAVDYIFEKYIEQSTEVKLLLLSRTPEETFFQTILMSSPVNDLVEINPTYQKEQNCKTYAYFTDIDKPFCGHPYILTIKEYDKLKFSDCFFARKFDIKKDKEVIRLIEERLLSQ